MRVGIFAGDITGPNSTVSDALTAAKTAAKDGFDSFWLPQIFSVDALTTLAVIGASIPKLNLGTAVVPTYPRHPIALAQQALTVQSASSGRLTLGVGLSHQLVIESMYGYSFDHPLRHMREYLSALMPLLDGEAADVSGETIQAHAKLDFAYTDAPDVVVAALGPKMLELAAQRANGTITWMTGPTTLENHTIPTLTRAADGKAMRVVAALPVCVTDDVDAARAHASKVFKVYGVLPSYRAMLDREGAAGPEDVALIGSEKDVRTQLERIAAAGVTDFAAVEFSGVAADRAATRDLLKSLL